tara:strand:+ start:519 stop:3299 length:2781 start_codon:yes stop_codon:yes gene_type:complete
MKSGAHRYSTGQIYKLRFGGSDQFYLADPNNVTIKKNGGKRWGVKKEFSLGLDACLMGHLAGTTLTDGYGNTGKRGVVLPPIRKSDSKCICGAIDVDGEIYNNDDIKIDLLKKVQKLKLPLVPCFSKSKGLHLYIFFSDWTDAQVVIDILHTFLHKLGLPQNTECFPKQAILKPTDTGNGIMLPFMHGVGNDWIKSFSEKKIITGGLEEFEHYIYDKGANAADIKIELPEPEPKSAANNCSIDKEDGGLTKLEILTQIKNKTIKQHPKMGGKYHSWIQVVIAKCIKQGYGDNEILKLIKEVHEDKRGIGYTWPESYQKQIDYARGDARLNIKNPGDTKILDGKSFDSAVALETIMKSYCYVMANDMFNKLGSADFYQDKQINNFHSHEVFIERGTLTKKLLSKPSFPRAETFITSAAHPPGLINITKPGMVPLIKKGIVLNIYIPNYLIAKKGDVKFIIEFFIWLIGEDKWKIIEQWIAYMVQHPGIKMKWAVVLVSVVEGVGKGLLARLCSRILGEDNVNENANYKHLTNTHNTLLIGTQLLVLNEVSLGDFKSKQEGTNTLKNFVGDDIYSCNFKGKPMVKLPNLTNFMLFSNDERVLGAPQGGRRYFFCNISKSEETIIQKTNEGFYQKAWDFMDSDVGAAALLHYFDKEVTIVDATIFKKRAPETNDLKELIEQSKHPLQKKLEYDLGRTDGRNKIFDSSWCGLITFDWLNEKLNTKEDAFDKTKYDWGSFGDDAIFKFLSANCIRWNNGDNTRQISINGVKQRFYVLDDARCPLPGKSYKDLAPKLIETIYLNYGKIRIILANEEKDYIEAKDNLLPNISSFKTWIEGEIELSKPNTANAKNYYGKFKGKTVEEVYEAIMKGHWEIIEKYPLDYLNIIRKFKKILDRGIRTPLEIVESCNEDGANINLYKYTERKKETINL